MTLARVYEWHSRVGGANNLDDTEIFSLDLLQGAGSAGDTVIRTIVFLTVAGTLSISAQAPGVAQLGVQVAAAAPVDPFGNPEVNDTEWLWLGHERLNASTESPDSVNGVWTASWAPALDSRASRVLGASESVWMSVELGGPITGGTYNCRYTTRVLRLLAE